MLLSQAAFSQGVKFGRYYMKQRMEQRRMEAARKAAANAAKETKAMKANSGVILDEYEDKDGDRVYRYVYKYDDNMMRSSERIYMKEKTDGQWSAEREITTGTYKYEYDSQKRLSGKTVTYTPNDYFESYRVDVNYGDGVTEYKKYRLDSEGLPSLIEGWSYYDNGVLASFTDYSRYGDMRSSTFDRNGLNTGYTYYGRKKTFSGDVNNQTVTYYQGEDWDDETSSYKTWRQVQQETYKYDTDNGKLIEYINSREYYDLEKTTYTYDGLGRLTAIQVFSEAGDDDEPAVGGDINGDGVPDRSSKRAASAAKAGGADNIEWELDYEETYTYWNNDVYGVGNSWHDVFGFDGPVSVMTTDEYGEKVTTTLNRNNEGRLTGITVDDGTGQSPTDITNITIDSEGRITKFENEDEYKDESSYTYEYQSIDYTWNGDDMNEAVTYSKFINDYGNEHNEGDYTTTTRYTYGDGKVEIRTYNEGSQTADETTKIEEKGTTRKVTHSYDNGSGTETDRIAKYVQTEDLSFVRPNLAADIEGMTADSTIVVSVAGRMVCAYEGHWNPRTGYYSGEFDNYPYYVNTQSGSTYFTVDHDGNQTVCRDIKGLPIYILTDGRLTKEYVYYDIAYGIGGTQEPDGPQAVMRTASIPEGQPYDEITYIYDNEGRLTGKTEVSVDENGTSSEEIKLEYVYNEASGITTVEAEAKAGVTLNGRRIGLSDNSRFSVCTISGQVLASGVTQYTFASPGIYIINAGRLTTKVLVK